MRRYWHQAILPDVPWLLAIAAVAMALRIAWVVRAKTFPVPGMDTLFYDNTARSLADGLGYINTGGVATALFPPGYPHALAIVYKVFGASLQAGQAFNVGISVALVIAIYALGRLAWGRSAALLGALLWALFPSQIIWTSLLMPEMLSHSRSSSRWR